MTHLNKSNLVENHSNILEFEYNGCTFYRNSKLRRFLNELFGATLVAVYSTNKDSDANYSLDWSGEDIVTVTANGVVSHLGNSEWAHFTKL
ncbi:hypothetical protein [Yersinia phage fHe-Yen9-04]|uniref:Uncharacterized protein n=1 Tax=Yersinia phage fHe-Yen9-04 TaxID=2052742 RepID=A0A2C9CXX3_9CAUD|nr:hypothetical protein FDJ41_gp401 [Yersinia phage fHe-Yen9-04]SOK58779.1 hypothetical protein [Yersinia phage fHe-Yen9-04]VUE36548.1 hypothetical protein [Yersinia phage fHe-Yen9-04]